MCARMRAHHLYSVMPAQRHSAASRGVDPVFAGFRVFLAGFAAKKTWMAGTSPAMTSNKWIT